MKCIIIIPVTKNYCKVCYSHFWWTWTHQSCLLWTNRHIWTRTCIVSHKVCEIHHVFQREYITKLITHFPVQFNYIKIMKYHYL